MPPCEQYEIWLEKAGVWEIRASFFDFKVASAIFGSYNYRMRLIRTTYEDGRLTERELLGEVGGTRQEP